MSSGLSYNELIDHIVNDKNVPNVIQVNDTVLDEKDRSISELKPRSKPWEFRPEVSNMAGNDKEELLDWMKNKEKTKAVSDFDTKTQVSEEYYQLEEEMAKK